MGGKQTNEKKGSKKKESKMQHRDSIDENECNESIEIKVELN